MKTAFLVIGSGIAGMSTALQLSELGEVVLLSKTELISGCTPLAQGGIAISKENEDHQKNHIADTLHAGAGVNHKKAVELLVSGSWNALQFLKRKGVRFDNTLHIEACHSEARIWHIEDKTGLYIAQTLSEKVKKNPHIHILENTFCTDLLEQENRVYGAAVFHNNKQERILANKTIIATGSAGQIYSETTNPLESTGDGIAMAARAGAHLQDMEFVQFHPTALATQQSPLFLLSEALRGEGAKIVDESGREICNPLLPRDQLSRIIFRQEKEKAIFLDLRHKEDAFWSERFPAIFKILQEYGLSPEKDIIPLLPAEHFFCGGIETDLMGRTNLKNLSAVGEVACTGCHGANRLASNSLLEGLVFSRQIFLDFQKEIQRGSFDESTHDGHFETTPYVAETAEDGEIRTAIQHICSNLVGVIRTKKNLNEAVFKLSRLHPMGTETKNMLAVATFVAEAARKRTESIGCHYVEKE
jgi:L-aspartate oxidase